MTISVAKLFMVIIIMCLLLILYSKEISLFHAQETKQSNYGSYQPVFVKEHLQDTKHGLEKL